MHEYKKHLPETEVDKFFKLFGDRKKKFKFAIQHINGKIISCKSDDPKIIKFLKEKGLK
tara:strand:+ start:457 stop:633 length:177 start_codon:yes stop_codon:yes gene_type:complete